VAERYEDIQIQFLSAGGTVIEVKASVLLREDEMVIDIPSQPSSGPNLVRGKKADHFFAGVDSLEHEIQVNIVARWSLLGDVYVGIWVEEGVEYLFSFRVPRSSVGPTRQTRRTK